MELEIGGQKELGSGWGNLRKDVVDLMFERKYKTISHFCALQVP